MLNKSLYPAWNKLSSDEKIIVNHIARQIPLSCEHVARIFILVGNSNIKETEDYIFKQYGYVVNWEGE